MVTHCSVNLADLLGDGFSCSPGSVLPPPLADLAGRLSPVAGERLQFERALGGADGLLDAVFSRSGGGGIVIEMLPVQPVEESVQCEWNAGLIQLIEDENLPAAREDLLEKVLSLSGYQRVMYYRFLGDGDGEVVAEIRKADVVGSYLGLRFPASDIPQVARRLYLLNPWRMIPAVAAPPVPVIGRAEAPDLTYSDLRSVSPVHALYLANMGVGASLSFPLVVGGQLWGLIACHHVVARQVSLARLSWISQEVRAHSLGLAAYLAQHRMRLVDGLQRRFDEVRGIVHAGGGLFSAWPALAAWLAREFSAEGAHLCHAEVRLSWGECLEMEALQAVDDWFTGHVRDLVWPCDSLRRGVAGFPLSQVAGVLAVKVRLAGGGLLRFYLTRREHIHEVAWGGNPDKPVEYHDGTWGIAPRRSFEEWIEKRMGYSRPWDNEDRLLALRLRELLLQLAGND